MKQGGVCEDAVEESAVKPHVDKILMQNLAAGIFPRHPAEGLAAVEPDGPVSAGGEVLEIPARPAPQVEQVPRPIMGDMPHQRRVVLGDIMVPRPFPIPIRAPLLMGESPRGQRPRFRSLHHRILPCR